MMNLDFANKTQAEIEQEIIDHLLKQNIVEVEKLEKVKRHAKLSSQSLLQAIISTNTLSEEEVYRNMAEVLGFNFIHIDPLSLDIEIVTASLPANYSKHHNIVPLSREGDQITVALCNPEKLKILEEIEHQLQIKVKPVIATPSDIEIINQGFFGLHTSLKAAETMLRAGSLESKNIFDREYLSRAEQELSPHTKPIVQAVDNLFGYAFEQRASDIHIEPKRNLSLVRMRIDGVLHDVHVMPTLVHSAIVSRIKILSRLDIAQKRIPQDGRIKREYKSIELEVRISTMPTVFGEKVVMRIFDPEVLLLEINKLGFFAKELALVKDFIGHNEGIILITGPTGSGKTTTLYSLLRELTKPEVNIITIEDPVELVYEDFNQITVDPKSGVSFANALRNVLRQDPDIIMVGEIRDEETANYAIQAALTGHLVFSTLHTIDAPSAITRLSNLGIPRYLIASTLIGIIAQRLVRKVCTHCTQDSKLPPDVIKALNLSEDLISKAQIKSGKGCLHCRQTGFLERTGIFETMNITPRTRQLIVSGADSINLRQNARKEGMFSLREVAVKKMLLGQTSYKEVFRVTGTSQYLIEDA